MSGGMTYRHALTHSLSALLFISSGCSGLDDPGGQGPIDEDVEEPDSDEEPDEDEEPHSVECSQEHFQIEIDDEGPSGVRGKTIYGMAKEYAAGEVTFFDGDPTELQFSLVYDDGMVDVTHASGEEEGCLAYTQTQVPVVLQIRTEDHRLSEFLAATLIHHSADPESVEIVAETIDFEDIGGTLQPPKKIGPEESSAEDFGSLSVELRMVLGEPRPMASAGDEVLEEAHGVILGVGELAEWSCPEEEGEGCMGSMRDFFLGSIRIKG